MAETKETKFRRTKGKGIRVRKKMGEIQFLVIKRQSIVLEKKKRTDTIV